MDVKSASFAAWKRNLALVWKADHRQWAPDKVILVDLFHDSTDYVVTGIHLALLLRRLTGRKVIGITGLVGVVARSCPTFSVADTASLADAVGIELIEIAPEPDEEASLAWLASEAGRQGYDLDTLEGRRLRDFLIYCRLNDAFPLGRFVYDTHLRRTLHNTIEEESPALSETAAEMLALDAALTHVVDRFDNAWLVTGHIDYAPFGLLGERVLHSGGQVIFFRNEGQSRLHIVDGPLAEGQTILGRLRQQMQPSMTEMIDDLTANHMDVVDAHFERVLSGQMFKSWRFVSSAQMAFPKGVPARVKRVVRESLGLAKDTPVIGLFSITFSDIPLADEQIHQDNFQWLAETLEAASRIPDINWFVRIHPYDLHYDTTGAMRRLVWRYERFEHIRFIDPSVPLFNTLLVCDVVSTIRGSPGLQGAMLGLTSVLSGRGYYSDFECALVAGNEDEYIRLMVEAARNPEFSLRAMQRARAFQYLEDVYFGNISSYLGSYGTMGEFGDPWARLASNLRWYDPATDPIYANLARALRNHDPRPANPVDWQDTNVAADAPLVEGPREGIVPLYERWPSGAVPLFGFHGPEAEGQWLDGKTAGLLIRFPQPSAGHLRVTLTLAMLRPATWPDARVSLHVDGHGLALRERADENGSDRDETILIFEGGPARFGDGEVLCLVFSFTGGIVPFDINHSDDRRSLSYCVRDIRWALDPVDDLPELADSDADLPHDDHGGARLNALRTAG